MQKVKKPCPKETGLTYMHTHTHTSTDKHTHKEVHIKELAYMTVQVTQFRICRASQ